MPRAIRRAATINPGSERFQVANTQVVTRSEVVDLMKEGTIYAVFCALFTVAVLLPRPGEPGYFQNFMMKEAVIFEEFPERFTHVKKTFYDVAKVEEIHQYLQGPFFTSLFTTDDYDDLIPYTGAMNGYNYLLGGVQFNMIRVKKGTCDAQPPGTINRPCYGPFSLGKQEEAPYGPGNKFTFTKRSKRLYWARLGWYPEAGYIFVLPGGKSPANETMAKIEQLDTDGFIDLSSRAMFIDFTVYNPNLQLYSIVRLVFEFLPTGGVVPSATFRTFKLDLYQNAMDFVVLAVEAVLALFILYFVYEEASELWSSGASKYFSSFWNVLDFIKVFSLSAIFYQRINFMSQMNSVQRNPSNTEFTDFWVVSTARQDEYNIAAVNCLVVYWKLLKYTGISPNVSALVRVLSRASKDIKYFMIILFVIVFGFVVSAHIVFGNDSFGFSTISQSILTLFEGINGALSFDELYDINRVFGPIFWIIFMLMALFVLLNVFLAIMGDAYMHVRTQKVHAEFGIGALASEFAAKIAKLAESKKDDSQPDAQDADIKAATARIDEAFNDGSGNGVGVDELAAALQRLAMLDSADAWRMAQELIDHFDIDGSKVLDKEELFMLKQTLMSKIFESKASVEQHSMMKRVAAVETKLEDMVGILDDISSQAIKQRREFEVAMESCAEEAYELAKEAVEADRREAELKQKEKDARKRGEKFQQEDDSFPQLPISALPPALRLKAQEIMRSN